MSGKMLQLNFKYSVTREEYEAAVSPLAEAFAAVSGLQWKVWIINEDETTAGAIYLFEDEAALGAFLESDLAASVLSHPALSDFEAKPFDIMAKQTAVTRGPVGEAVAS